MKNFILISLLLAMTWGSTIAQHHNNATRAYLGVESTSVSTNKAEKMQLDNPNGNMITRVVNNTAAERIGLQAFDYLVGFDDNDFTDNHSFSRALRNYQAGDEATVHFVRQGQRMSLPLTFGSRANIQNNHTPPDQDAFLGVRQSHDDMPENTDGVRVNIVSQSTAEGMGMEDKDIITQINDYNIYDWHDLSAAIDMMSPGETIKINYLRDGVVQESAMPIKSYQATYAEKSQNNNHNNTDQDTEEEQEEEDIAIAAVEMTEEEMPEVDMIEVSQEEADDMKEKVGVDMPVINNLQIQKLNVFPNPSDGVFNLIFDLPEEGPTTIQVYNSAGQRIYDNQMLRFTGKFQDRIDISNNARGTYFLMVAQNGNSITRKLILQ